MAKLKNALFSVGHRVFVNAGGFTLTEALATVIIVALVSGGLATSVSVATSQFSKSMAQSEAQMLYSSLKQDLVNDLTYTRDISGEDDGSVVSVTSYQSSHHADEKPLRLRALSDKGNVVSAAGGDVTGLGQLALCSEDETVKNRLLGKSAYSYGLRACVKSFSYDKAKRMFTVNLEVRQAGTENSIEAGEFTVKALNGSALPQPQS